MKSLLSSKLSIIFKPLCYILKFPSKEPPPVISIEILFTGWIQLKAVIRILDDDREQAVAFLTQQIITQTPSYLGRVILLL